MKFHGRRVQELTETGLQNVTMLFLLLAHHANIADVVSARVIESCYFKGIINSFKVLVMTGDAQGHL